MKATNILRILLLIVCVLSCSQTIPNDDTDEKIKIFKGSINFRTNKGFKAVYSINGYDKAYVIEYEGKQYLINTSGGIIEIK